MGIRGVPSISIGVLIGSEVGAGSSVGVGSSVGDTLGDGVGVALLGALVGEDFFVVGFAHASSGSVPERKNS